jgi:hypothetical protein
MTTYHIYHDTGSNTIEADSYRFANAQGIEGAAVFYVAGQEVAVFKNFRFILADKATLPIVDVVPQEEKAA